MRGKVLGVCGIIAAALAALAAILPGVVMADEYTLTPDDVTFESGNPDNYSLEYIDNALTVMKLG